METRCLMIKTKDNRKFFTHEKNFPQLIEFSKTFHAEISVVRVQEAPIMDLAELAPAICDSNYVAQEPDYELVKVVLPTAKKSRAKILEVAKKVRAYIYIKFSKDEKVSLKDLKRHFKRYELSTPALCNHIRRVRKELENAGVKICKIAAGTYQMNK